MGRFMGKKKKYIIGVDLGGTKMLAGLLDRDYKLKATEKSRVSVNEGKKAFLKSLVENTQKLLKEYRLDRKDLLGIGIGCPGIIDSAKGVILTSPNIPFLTKEPLAKKIAKIFKVPVAIGNDVNVGLLGEQRLGAARGHKNVIGIFLGTGVGGAFIFNNEIYGGASGGAGEVGHMMIDPMGPKCGCGKRGCLETFVGRVGVAAEAAVLAARQEAPKLYNAVETDISKIKSGVLEKAVKAGDDAIKELIQHRSKRLGIAMGSLVNLLNPEMIVLGGGMVEALGGIIIPEAKDWMNKSAMPALVKKVKVSSAKLGDNAIVKGAAVMIKEQVEGE